MRARWWKQGLQLVCHVVNEIILHLRQTLLSEQRNHRKYKRYQQDKRKYQRRYEKGKFAVYIIPFCREISLNLFNFAGGSFETESGCKSHPDTFEKRVMSRPPCY